MGVRYVVFAVLILMSFCLGLAFGQHEPSLLLPHSDTSIEQKSPSDWIAQENIHILENNVVIDITDPQWAVFTDTNSMDPVLDQGAHGIQVVPGSPDDLEIGDIISFTSTQGIIIHRIIDIGHDDQGWYAITKGDNNAVADPGKLRFSQVHRVLVGILY